jgi:hypothetical protein
LWQFNFCGLLKLLIESERVLPLDNGSTIFSLKFLKLNLCIFAMAFYNIL